MAIYLTLERDDDVVDPEHRDDNLKMWVRKWIIWNLLLY